MLADYISGHNRFLIFQKGVGVAQVVVLGQVGQVQHTVLLVVQLALDQVLVGSLLLG